MTIDELANKVAAGLPEGYVIAIEIERDAGYIFLTVAETNVVIHPCPDSTLEDQVLKLLDKAQELAMGMV